jgi:hypothetical protein
LVERYFEKIVGQKMVGDDTLSVPALGIYGIGGWQVKAGCWREIAIPKLESCFRAAK